MQQLLPVLYNSYRRFKQLSFESVKALVQAALITQVGAGCVGFCENLLAKQSPEKVTRDDVYNQNGYNTRSHDRHSTLIDRQINKSDGAIMWLYTSCKQQKKKSYPHQNI